ncbi:hypothetical protein BC936DRAFT_146984 [Jimgerdemannia flammicorona]|uniref:Methyltransferase domain-containing protein n=1 Tax=Jimgerdemannia flammicorona TaxID=994334 RepID=A0A433D6F3_9FUNG|nr:hypothetical protein BC936DRAFT_146984 [Jimgerdemannia flammicorona]
MGLLNPFFFFFCHADLTGCWTMDMANDFPNSHFVGVDVTDVFPKDGLKRNCTFVKANTLEGLPFEDDTFDYVFQVLTFTTADWPKAISELVRVTKPGGWVELVETDCKLERIPLYYHKFGNAFIAQTRARGFDLDFIQKLGSVLGGLLVDIDEDYIVCYSSFLHYYTGHKVLIGNLLSPFSITYFPSTLGWFAIPVAR